MHDVVPATARALFQVETVCRLMPSSRAPSACATHRRCKPYPGMRGFAQRLPSAQEKLRAALGV